MRTELLASIRTENEAALARLRSHPFIRIAHAKALTRDKAHRMLEAMSCDSRAFLVQLRAGVNRLRDLPQYEALLPIMKRNLDDEEGNDNPEEAHWRHYVHLALQLGYTEEALLGYEGNIGVKYAVQLAHSVPFREVPCWVGYMLLNEGATPVTYGAEEVALRVYYPELKTKFFTMHVEVDEHHVAELYEAVRLLPDSAYYEVLQDIAMGELGMVAILDEAFGLFG
jgi:pyrroloquinoline quinone (PQQ) biosynthesis protein C